jgi:hypothetical protein
MKLTNLLFLTVMCCLTISCKQKDISEIEKIIVDEEFIKSKTIGHDSIAIDSSSEYKNTATTYFLKDGFRVLVSRDSLKRIQAWWLQDSKGQNIEGAEVSKITGQIRGKLHFVNGKIDGEVKYYYDDGRVKSKGQFKNGTWWGEWKNYDKDGNFTSLEQHEK